MGSDDRRHAVLAAATRLFRHYGHAKTTMADIAREAGVGIGSVYLDFPSKDSIVEELSLGTHRRVLDAMRAVVKKHNDFADCFIEVMGTRTACLADLASEGEHACELMHCQTKSVRSVHERFQAEERTLLRDMLEDARKGGQIDIKDARETAALVQRAFVSLAPPWVFALQKDAAVAIATDLACLLLVGVLARQQSRARPRRR